MAELNQCHICGGRYIPVRDRWKCEYCDAYAPINIGNEISTLLTVANQDLRNNKFDDAYDKFRDIASRNPDISDAFFGITCSEYGIKFEDDYDGKKIPTCYNASYESLYENENFKKAMELADPEQKEYYKKVAGKIEATRKEWIEKASKEKPYDIFLSYKSTEDGKATEDEQDVYELYNYLTSKGYRVFFAKVSLKDKTGERYEPYIFNALNTAKVMIVYGSKIEYFDATWVKNEWKRYLKRISNHDKQSDSLLVVYKGLNPGRLPKPLDKIQNLDRNSLDFLNSLLSKIENITSRSETKTTKISKSTIKEVKAKDKLEIETIKKRSLSANGNGFKKQEVEINVKKREIGKYQVGKITPDVERKLKVAEVYVKQNTARDYRAALKIYREVLEEDEHNSTAIIGRILSETQYPTVDNLCNNISSFKKLAFLMDGINYGKEEDANKILTALSVECSKNIGVNNERAKMIFILIMEYDSKIVHGLYLDIISKSPAYINSVEDILVDVVDNSLNYIYSNFKEYEAYLYALTNAFINAKKITVANKYIEMYKKTVGENYSLVIFDLKIKYGVKNENDAIWALIEKEGIEKLDEIVTSMSVEDAERILAIAGEVVTFALRFRKYDLGASLLDYLLEIDFKGRELVIESSFQYVLENSQGSFAPAFEALLKTYNKNQKKEYIKMNLVFANGILTRTDDYTVAGNYFERVLEYEPKNEEAIYGKWMADIGVKNKLDLLSSLNKTQNFTPFERLLSISKNEIDVAKVVDSFCNTYFDNTLVEILKFSYQIESNDWFDTFDKFLSYYPESHNGLMVELITKMADELFKAKYYNHAERYLAMSSSYDTDNHEIYWMLLKCKLKCQTDDDLIKQKVLITTIVEYDNAINAAYNNQEALEKYLSVRNAQEKWLASERKKKITKRVKLILIITFLSILFVLDGIAAFGIIRERKEDYTSFKSLIEEAKYDEAESYYSNLNRGSKYYKDAPTLMTLLNARKEILSDYVGDRTIEAIENIKTIKYSGVTIVNTIIDETANHDDPDYKLGYYEVVLGDIDFDEHIIYMDYISVYITKDSYIVKLDATGGTFDGSDFKVIKEGYELSLPIPTLPDGNYPYYSVVGLDNVYEFLGWYYDGFQICGSDGIIIYWPISENVTLTAEYKRTYSPAFNDHILFGNYPQTEEKNEEMIEKLNNLAGKLPTANRLNGWKYYDYYYDAKPARYMFYKDLDIDNDGNFDYRGVYLIKYRNDDIESISNEYKTRQELNGYEIMTTYWFKYEPIEWIVYDVDGEMDMITAKVIDAQNYNNTNEERKIKGTYGSEIIMAGNYEYSSLKDWMIKFKMAALPLDGNVRLPMSSIFTKYLYYEDRWCLATDYARIQGVWEKTGDETTTAEYWIRGENNKNFNVASVMYYKGEIISYRVTDTAVGVRPVCNIGIGDSIIRHILTEE